MGNRIDVCYTFTELACLRKAVLELSESVTFVSIGVSSLLAHYHYIYNINAKSKKPIYSHRHERFAQFYFYKH